MVNYTQKRGIYQPAETGEGYALFNCNAPRDKIEAYLQGRLPQTQECQHDVPKPHELGLELKLEEVSELVKKGDVDTDLLAVVNRESVYSRYPEAYKHLMPSAKPVPLRSLKYAIRAKGKQTNAEACEALTTVMNDVYLKFGERKPFTAAVLGKDDDGNYGLWDDEPRTSYQE